MNNDTLRLTHMGKKHRTNNHGQAAIGLPPDFLARLELMYGPSTTRRLVPTFRERPTTFRTNTQRVSTKELTEKLRMLGFHFTPVPWYRDAFILKNKTKRELLDSEPGKNGLLYVQSLASMVPPLILDPQPGERVLDLSAAPGSKTSQIAAMMNREGELVANEPNKVRFFKLLHNMQLLHVFTTQGDFLSLTQYDGRRMPKQYENYFDRILLDAPCSAEARFLPDDPKTFGYWKTRKIQEMAYLQRGLLLASWRLLRPGGTLVYSTCTLAPEENEENTALLLKRQTDASLLDINIKLARLPIVKSWQKHVFPISISKAMRIAPDTTIESFYVARFKKSTMVA
jgi:NOL1/NOP2/sun family putative RNA methylase